MYNGRVSSFVSASIIALAACCLLPVASAYGETLNLQTVGARGYIGGSIFMQGDLETSTGTGVIDSIVRIQATGTEKGYNTNGQNPFDTDSSYCKAIQLSAVPIAYFGGVAYREFMLDINQNLGGISEYLSLDQLAIFVESSASIDETTGPYPANFSNCIYSLDAIEDSCILLDASISSGSGQGDMFAYIPSSLFGTNYTKYIYLYSEFGQAASSNDGFEEWAIGVGGAINPEPATLSLLALGGVALLKRRRK